jgi:hypothetical protein
MLMISLDAMTEILAAYPVRDLQHFNHVLQRFEGLGADLPTVRATVQKRIDAELSRSSRVASTKPATADHGRCPHCQAPLSPVITGDDSAVLGCKKCRYSTMVEG